MSEPIKKSRASILLPSTDEMYSSVTGTVINDNLDNYLDQFDGQSPNILDPNFKREAAARQSNWEQAGHALARGLINAIPSTIGNLAAIADVEDYHNTNNEVGNWLTTAMKGITQSVNESMPILRTNPGEALDLGDSGWWFENGSSLLESAVGFVATGYVTGAVTLSAFIKAGKFLNYLNSLGKTAQLGDFGMKVARGGASIVNNLALNQAEGIGVATDVYQKVYFENKDLMSDDEAKLKAAQYAAEAINFNRMNMLLNMSSTAALIRKPSLINETVKKVTGKSRITNLGLEGLQELTEEEINLISEKKALKNSRGERFTGEDFIETITSAEGIEAGLLGAIGGMAQTGFTQAMNASKYNPFTRVKSEVDQKTGKIKYVSADVANNKRYENQQEMFKKYQKWIEDNDLPSSFDVFMSAKEALDLQNQLKEARDNKDTKAEKEISDKLFHVQAFNAFNTGTTDQLINVFKHFRDLTEEEAIQRNIHVKDRKESDPNHYKNVMNKSINKINKLGEEFIKSKAYINSKEVYRNRAVKSIFDENKEEIDRKISTQENIINDILAEMYKSNPNLFIGKTKDGEVSYSPNIASLMESKNDSKYDSKKKNIILKELDKRLEGNKQTDDYIFNIEEQKFYANEIAQLESEYENLTSEKTQKSIIDEAEKLKKESIEKKRKEKAAQKRKGNTAQARKDATGLKSEKKEETESKDDKGILGTEVDNDLNIPLSIDDDTDITGEVKNDPNSEQALKEAELEKRVENKKDTDILVPITDEQGNSIELNVSALAELDMIEGKEDDFIELAKDYAKNGIIDKKTAQRLINLMNESKSKKTHKGKDSNIAKKVIEVIDPKQPADSYENNNIAKVNNQINKAVAIDNNEDTNEEEEAFRIKGADTLASLSFAYLARSFKNLGSIAIENVNSILQNAINYGVLDPSVIKEGSTITLEKYDNYDGEITYRGELVKWSNIKNTLSPEDLIKYTPIAIKDDKGKIISYVHSYEWIDTNIQPDKYGTREINLEAIENVRNEVLTNDKIEAVITARSEGYYFTVVNSNGRRVYGTIADRFKSPDVKLGFVGSDGQIYADKGVLASTYYGKNIENYGFPPGYVVLLTPSKHDGEQYTGMAAAPVRRKAIESQKVDSIIKVLSLSRAIKNRKQLSTKEQKAIKALSDLGYYISPFDDKTHVDIGNYLDQFINNHKTQEGQTFEQLLSNYKNNTPIISFQYGRLRFGYGKSKNKGIDKSIYDMTDREFVSLINSFKDFALKGQNGDTAKNFQVYEKVDGSILTDRTSKPLVYLDPVNLTVANLLENQTGQDYYKSRLTTAFKDINLGTKENPNYIYRIQPQIHFNLKSDVQGDATKAETEIKEANAKPEESFSIDDSYFDEDNTPATPAPKPIEKVVKKSKKKENKVNKPKNNPSLADKKDNTKTKKKTNKSQDTKLPISIPKNQLDLFDNNVEEATKNEKEIVTTLVENEPLTADETEAVEQEKSKDETVNEYLEKAVNGDVTPKSSIVQQIIDRIKTKLKKIMLGLTIILTISNGIQAKNINVLQEYVKNNISEDASNVMKMPIKDIISVGQNVIERVLEIGSYAETSSNLEINVLKEKVDTTFSRTNTTLMDNVEDSVAVSNSFLSTPIVMGEPVLENDNYEVRPFVLDLSHNPQFELAYNKLGINADKNKDVDNSYGIIGATHAQFSPASQVDNSKYGLPQLVYSVETKQLSLKDTADSNDLVLPYGESTVSLVDDLDITELEDGSFDISTHYDKINGTTIIKKKNGQSFHIGISKGENRQSKINSKTSKDFRSLRGGLVLFGSTDGEVSVMVSGSVDNIFSTLSQLKKKYPDKKFFIFRGDTGTYNTPQMSKNNKTTVNDINQYSTKNTWGNNQFIIMLKPTENNLELETKDDLSKFLQDDTLDQLLDVKQIEEVVKDINELRKVSNDTLENIINDYTFNTLKC